MFVYNVGITWVRHWSEVVLPAILVFNWSRHSCHPPIRSNIMGPQVKRNNMTTEHENGKESVLYWILFSVFANLELLLLVHWRPISQISYTVNCLDLSL